MQNEPTSTADFSTTPLLFLDTETTGTDPHTDRIIEIGAVGFPRGILTDCVRYQRLVNPGVGIPPESSFIHGIHDDDVASADSWETCGAQVTALMQDYQNRGGFLVTYNGLGYDGPIIDAENERHGIPGRVLPSGKILDVYLFYKWHNWHLAKTAKLGKAATALGLPHAEAHRAVGDCVTTAMLFKHGVTKGWIPNDLVRALEQQQALLRYFKAEFTAFDRYAVCDRLTSDIMYLAIGKNAGPNIFGPTSIGFLSWLLQKDATTRSAPTASKYPPISAFHRNLLKAVTQGTSTFMAFKSQYVDIFRELSDAHDAVRESLR